MKRLKKFLEKNIFILIIILIISSSLIYLFNIRPYFIEKVAPLICMLYGI